LPAIPRTWLQRASKLHVCLKIYQKLQGVAPSACLLGLRWPGSPRLPVSGSGGGTLGTAIKHAVHLLPLPFAQQGGPHRLTDWVVPASQAGLLNVLVLLSAAHSRAAVVTADRVAALAAGDARAAAAALLRAQGLLAGGDWAGQALPQTLQGFADGASQRTWQLRRDAALHGWAEPPVEVRVRELLRWSDTSKGRHLLALAELRRGLLWPAGQQRTATSSPRRDGLRASMQTCEGFGGLVLAVLFGLPLVVAVEPVRWSAWCTIVLTAWGFLSALQETAAVPVAVFLAAYAACAWAIWWNHLMGGAQSWSKLSKALTHQLADQNHLTAGLVYLTRDWADMANQSMAALDQELRGSWRTNLQELASKFVDLQQEPQPSSSPSKRLQRALTEPAACAGEQGPLWLEVDQAVQRVLRVETARMRCASKANNPKELEAMMAWWVVADGTTVNAAAVAQQQGSRLLAQEGDDLETLSSLLLSGRLHRRYDYPSFCEGQDTAATEPKEWKDGAAEFRRLEQALSSNFESLRVLRDQLAPLENPPDSLRLFGWADVSYACAEIRRVLRGSLDPSSDKDMHSRRDSSADRRLACCLAFASLAGGLGCPVAAAAAAWVWAAAAVGFCTANLVLLCNYRRLSLPHVYRRFERQLSCLTRRQESLLAQIGDVQRSARCAGVMHARACIFLQSTNVLRNVNYVVVCIKTEVQRAALGQRGHSHRVQARLVLCGLRLLLEILPHCGQQRRVSQGSLRCASAVVERQQALLRQLSSEAVQHATGERPQQAKVSQTQLWLFFRMVHLTTALPLEVQGQMRWLLDRYIRPMFLDGHLPLHKGPASEPQPALGVFPEPGDALGASAKAGVDARDLPASLPTLEEAPQRAMVPRHRSGVAKAAEGAQGAVEKLPSRGTSSEESGSEELSHDTAEALKELAVTRHDIRKLLGRLPPQALTDRVLGREPEIQEFLRNIFSSVVVFMLKGAAFHTSSTGGTPHSPDRHRGSIGPSATGRAENDGALANSKCVAAATGFRYGERVYALDGIRTSLMLSVAIVEGRVAGEGQGWWGSTGGLLNSEWWGSTPLGRGMSNISGQRNAGIQLEEVEVPLSALLEEHPQFAAVATTWGELVAASSELFGGSSLRRRRRALRRAKAARWPEAHKLRARRRDVPHYLR